MHRFYVWDKCSHQCAHTQQCCFRFGSQLVATLNVSLNNVQQLLQHEIATKFQNDCSELNQFVWQCNEFGIDLNDARVFFAKCLQIIVAGESVVHELAEHSEQLLVLEPMVWTDCASNVGKLLANCIAEGEILLNGSYDFRLASVCIIETHFVDGLL